MDRYADAPGAGIGDRLRRARHQRHKYEGTVLSGIVYPLVRALLANASTNPSARISRFPRIWSATTCAGQLSENETSGAGSDVWIATQAMTNGFRLGEARLGPRHDGAARSASRIERRAFAGARRALHEVARTAAVWQRTRGSEAVPNLRPGAAAGGRTAAGGSHATIEAFRLGYKSLQEIWRIVLPPATLVELKRLASRGSEEFRMPDAVWARIVYDFILAHRTRAMDRNHLLRALTPLYLGWLASYVLQVRDASAVGAEQRIEALCIAYETQKAYLISRWRWPDRFNP